jgi:hypothetical protein
VYGVALPQMNNAVLPPHFIISDAAEALNLSRHIINNVDIVDGTIVDKNAQGKIISSETTQWTVFKDLTNRVLLVLIH